jgi:hypothetical protein
VGHRTAVPHPRFRPRRRDGHQHCQAGSPLPGPVLQRGPCFGPRSGQGKGRHGGCQAGSPLPGPVLQHCQAGSPLPGPVLQHCQAGRPLPGQGKGRHGGCLMDNPLETVKKQLRKDLKDYRKYLHVLNRMNFDALPLHFNASYAGISLNEISLPTVHGDPEGIFDAWLWPVLEGRTDTQLDELAEVTNKDFALFVSQDPDIGVCTVLLMCALTRIPGTTMTCDKDSVLLHYKDRVFGIDKGPRSVKVLHRPAHVSGSHGACWPTPASALNLS